MFAQDTPFIYHLRSLATPSSSGWYMNGISWATIVYLLLIAIKLLLMSGSLLMDSMYNPMFNFKMDLTGLIKLNITERNSLLIAIANFSFY